VCGSLGTTARWARFLSMRFACEAAGVPYYLQGSYIKYIFI